MTGPGADGCRGRARVIRRRVDGILLLDKPVGPSSNQVLQHAKRLYRAEKAGHTGTLDPFASGLLPIMFGEATKFVGHLLSADKSYDARLRLGVSTTTGDRTGEILQRLPVDLHEVRVRCVVASFAGDQMQVPPMHSALKRGGVPLYELARRGASVEREARPVRIHELSVVRYAGDELDLHVRCSKGTYIRVLAEDIGRALGCGATVEALRRVGAGEFGIGDARTFEVLEALSEADRDRMLLPVEAALGALHRLDLDQPWVARVQQGQSVPIPRDVSVESSLVRVYSVENNTFIGVARADSGTLHPIRLVLSKTSKNA